ncbi:MAG: fumarylacetoacetate hydrolase family protein [Alphaproteobacteria bacterium]|nr:fumarylacetoacetate hydrolase family protein [Alphaproteobacteria bacterium]
MPDYVIAPPPQAAVAVAGTDALFPVRRVYCVGRNYAEHAREMGADPTREDPFFFSKPADALVACAPGQNGVSPYPPGSKSVHHEMELVVAIGKGGADIPAERALEHVFGYAPGLDLTRRDLQGEAKKKGQPWEMGKGFDKSAPIGRIVPAAEIGHPAKGTISLKVNGETRQKSDLSQMIWNVPETIAFLSRLVALAPGDLIFTGTPEGVAAVVKGDRLEGHIDGVGDLQVTIG